MRNPMKPTQTMIEILPENLANHVEKKCGSLAGESNSKPSLHFLI